MPVFVTVAVGSEVDVVGAGFGNLVIIVIVRIPCAALVDYLELCVLSKRYVSNLVFINVLFVEG